MMDAVSRCAEYGSQDFLLLCFRYYSHQSSSRNVVTMFSCCAPNDRVNEHSCTTWRFELVRAMEKLLQSLDTAVANSWSRLHNDFLPDEPRLQFTALTSLVHAIAVYSSALFFMALGHFGWCKRFRIQGDKEPDRKLVRKCQIHMMISCLIRC